MQNKNKIQSFFWFKLVILMLLVLLFSNHTLISYINHTSVSNCVYSSFTPSCHRSQFHWVRIFRQGPGYKRRKVACVVCSLTWVIEFVFDNEFVKDYIINEWFQGIQALLKLFVDGQVSIPERIAGGGELLWVEALEKFRKTRQVLSVNSVNKRTGQLFPFYRRVVQQLAVSFVNSQKAVHHRKISAAYKHKIIGVIPSGNISVPF